MILREEVVQVFVEEGRKQQIVVLEMTGVQGEDGVTVRKHARRAVDHHGPGEDPPAGVVGPQEPQELIPCPRLGRVAMLQLDFDRGGLRLRGERRNDAGKQEGPQQPEDFHQVTILDQDYNPAHAQAPLGSPAPAPPPPRLPV